MTDLEALKARLREWPKHEQVKTYNHTFHIVETGSSYTTKREILQSPKPFMCESADAIERLEADNARLRAALEPFAFREMEKDEGLADTQYVWETIHSDRVQDWFSYEEIGAARAALKGQSNEG